ncbi:adenosylcobinamide-GDP ribazoletransferase [Pseudodesulfovibrio senegalensis]|uniref:Adenosylcobinamide-GDP ribazoletransferase n=1 Tax=Pseudodesulfovibrio senegalensis TaxID=1721087 RepID=A0A6N6N1J9_9BACT|nr:adenosylcobinamide-GDP ribazoletransferase [Pseudodesulfovibrio senegalensis]KAB1440774.1 adenosylcobinamide-GDP ribazoletransferase [Pseudodesulfovibrio senegalensis]
MNMIRNFLNTLGFMTRLAPARVVPDNELFASMPLMPLVGLILGLVLAAPWKLGLLAGHPWVQAWLVVMLGAWLTRGLHHDGLADIFDAVTTHAGPERFWEVVKDSRCGAFGVLALVGLMAGQMVLFHALLQAQAFAALAFVFVFGRFGSVAFAYMARDIARPGMGSLLMQGATFTGTTAALVLTIVLGLLGMPPLALLLAFALLGCVLFSLHSLARTVEGANGDFLGAATVLAELCAALAAVALP